MIINVITSMPNILDAINHGVIGHAINKGHIQINVINMRTFSQRLDNRIDDRPFGGGPGMIIEAPILERALQSIQPGHIIELSPQGQTLTTPKVQQLAKHNVITLICGRYEGIDHRAQSLIDEQVSIGDYVLSGGEIPALVILDALIRVQPSVISNPSIEQDSFGHNQLLDHNHYTKPKNWKDQTVPDILLSGHHGKISTHRLQESIGNTWLKRPDLLIGRKFCERELALFINFVQNHNLRGENHD